MRRLQYTLWAIGNLTLAPALILLFTGGAVTIPILFQDGFWPIALLLVITLPVGTSMWPLWIFAEGMTSVALVRKAKTRSGRLAYLKWDNYGPTIELTTRDPAAVRWHEWGQVLLRPGWRGYAAAVLLTASAGLALAVPWALDWPRWASIVFGLGWVAGWVWYATRVRAELARTTALAHGEAGR